MNNFARTRVPQHAGHLCEITGVVGCGGVRTKLREIAIGKKVEMKAERKPVPKETQIWSADA